MARSDPEVLEIVERALNTGDPRAQQEYLETATAGDAQMLEAARRLLRDRQLETGFFATGAGVLVEDGILASGEVIGAWRIDQMLGAGGMGEVYAVSRADGQFEMSAALKLISLASEEAWARFTRERQILADLDHPGIARLFDGGVTASERPFLVMERIEGDDTSGGTLMKRGREARLRLFVQLCRALEHAHQRLIAHGDIKPANIMLTPEGEIKLLDFGVASLLQEDREGAKAPISVAYASPEQRAGSGASLLGDVYSLGLTLAEWLTGETPVSDRFERACASLPRDLGAVIAKATAPLPEDRYQSVAQLREDVNALIETRPVSARDGTALYRLGLFARRNPAVALLSGGLLASLVAGVIAISLFALELQASLDREGIARIEAQNRAALATEAQNLMVNVAGQAITSEETGDPFDLRGYLNGLRDEAIAQLESDPQGARTTLFSLAEIHGGRSDIAQLLATLEPIYLADDPESGGAVYVTIRALLDYGLYVMDSEQGDRAQPALERAIALIDRQPYKRIYAADRLEAEAYIAMTTQNPQEKLAIVSRLDALADQLQAGDSYAKNSAVNLWDLAAYLSVMAGDSERSIPLSEKALALNRTIVGPKALPDDQIGFALVGAYKTTGRNREAVALNSQLIAEAREQYGPSIALANRLLMQGLLHVNLDEPAEAIGFFEEALPIFNKFDRQPSENGFSVMTNIARENVRLAGDASAMQEFDFLLSEYGAQFETFPRFGYYFHKRKAEAYEILERNEDAIAAYEDAIEYARRGGREDYVNNAKAGIDALKGR